MANAPDRYLTWRWEDPDDEKLHKLKYQPDSKKPNAGTFVLAKEDHTLGNLLRLQLLRDPGVRFAGYRMPHPLIFDCHVRVETLDARLTPIQVQSAAVITHTHNCSCEYNSIRFFCFFCLVVNFTHYSFRYSNE